MSKVRTLPVVLGRKKIRNILLLLNTILIFWLMLCYSQDFFNRYLFVLIFDIAYGYWYIIHFSKDNIKIGMSLDLLVDGEFILLAFLAFASDHAGFL